MPTSPVSTENGTSPYSPYTATNVDALVMITEWNEFRALDVAHVKSLLRAPVVVDLRNIYRLEEMADACFAYDSVGRPVVASAAAPMLNVVSASPRVQK